MEAELLRILKERLRVELSTREVYTGGCDGSGNLYRQDPVVKIYFGGELVAES